MWDKISKISLAALIFFAVGSNVALAKNSEPEAKGIQAGNFVIHPGVDASVAYHMRDNEAHTEHNDGFVDIGAHLRTHLLEESAKIFVEACLLSMPGNVVLLELVLHETARDAEQFSRMSLNEIGTNKSAFDEGRLDAVERICEIELNRQKVHSALELRFFAANLRRQVFDADDRAGDHDHTAFQHVLELAYVAGPVVAGEVVLGFRAEGLDGDAVVFRYLFPEMGDEERDVFTAFPQRRDGDVDDVEAVEEVFAEGAFLDHLRQVTVGGGHHADIDADAFRSADAFKHAFLKDAQELDLQIHAQFSYLVKEERALIRLLEAAAPGGDGAGE